MNPYEQMREKLKLCCGTFERAAVDAVLSLMADSYANDLDPSDRAADYVVRHVIARFGPTHPITRSLYKLRAERSDL